MKAMILAAGYGKRLLPLTKDTPKPLLKVGNKTLIERNINNLLESGFSEIVINVSHLSKLIEGHVKEKFPKNNILFSFEERPLGTGGG
ncbi:MAG: sugar phosphate nucleotidyltransferase, partial [Gammaproteobacteria bacterium]